MHTEILINATPYENRIALVEKDTLLEFHLERPAEKGLVGNIYQGRVVRVLPGMQAAFVDIGLERTGFLYVDDVHVNNQKLEQTLAAHDQGCGPRLYVGHQVRDPAHRSSSPAIEELLREGQTVLVQIAKEPIGTKGARLTCHITLPCRNLVFMPLTDHIGISRKIADETVRQELRERIDRLRPKGTGFIVRTVAEHISSEELEADMEFLLLLWDEILSTAARSPVPGLVYKDLDMILRSVRDLFTEDVRELIIDSESEYRKLLSFVETFAPHLKEKITLYDQPQPLFEAYGIEVDINRALDKKVWLRSGGYIIIETTEALTVIDVNTGRYVGKNDLAETIFKTNMEAVREIAYQLRLRNIGGIIIVDFIDMDNEQHREELYAAFQEAMQADKSRVNILKLSEFGLVQMTRKRTRESIEHILCGECPVCKGRGTVKTIETICFEIMREIVRVNRAYDADKFVVYASPKVAEALMGEESHMLAELEVFVSKQIKVQTETLYNQDKYDVVMM